MGFLLPSREIPSGERNPLAKFNVVIVYEDFGTRKQAKKCLAYVAEEFGSDFEIGHRMWRLDILQDPKLSGRAALSLSKSDLLIISIRGEHRLSVKTRALIDERLAEAENRASALVVLFEGAATATRSSVYACLATLARRHGLDFFEQGITEKEGQEALSLKLVWVF
jgi:hypothetical protein